MNLGKKLAEGFAVDTDSLDSETEEPRTGPIEIVPQIDTGTSDVTAEAPAEPVTV
ncbi:MAG: hypothetical protein ACT4RN_00685 [Pseudonocardia sp.]